VFIWRLSPRGPETTCKCSFEIKREIALLKRSGSGLKDLPLSI